MSTTTVSDSTLSMGTVASQTFGSIGRNIVTFGVLAFLAAVPQQVLFFYLNRATATGLRAGPTALTTVVGGSFAVLIASVFLSYLLYAAIVYGTIVDLNGQRASFGRCIGAAFRVFLPLVGLSIISTIGIAIGFVLLIVPGIILALGWCVAVPVRVVERTSIFDALSRSWSLTSGYKGTIFLLWLVFVIGAAIFGAVGLAFAGTMSFLHPGPPTSLPIFYFLYQGVVRGLESMVGAAGAAAVYYQLRVIKEGVGAEQLAAVFD